MTRSIPETAGLVAAAARGDETAWREIVERYWRRVYAMGRASRLDGSACEDVAQSVFATVAEQLGSGAYSESGRFEAWLFRVAMNRVRDEVRRRKRQATPMEPASVAERVGGKMDRASWEGDEGLRRALDCLPECDQEVVKLRHWGGLSFAQMAEALEEPVGTLLARHHRALKKLREALARSSDDEFGMTNAVGVKRTAR